MQTIITKYLPCTNFRGSRVKASTESGKSITLGWLDELNSNENHDRAALAIAAKMQWEGDFIRGALHHAYVYVFAKDERVKNPFKAGKRKLGG